MQQMQIFHFRWEMWFALPNVRQPFMPNLQTIAGLWMSPSIIATRKISTTRIHLATTTRVMLTTRINLPCTFSIFVYPLSNKRERRVAFDEQFIGKNNYYKHRVPTIIKQRQQRQRQRPSSNEIGMRPRDVLSLCRIGVSTKSKNKDTTG